MFVFSFISFLHHFHPYIKAATKVQTYDRNSRLPSVASARPPSSESYISTASSVCGKSDVSHRRLPLPSESGIIRPYKNRLCTTSGGTIDRLYAARDRLSNMIECDSHDDVSSPCDESGCSDIESECYTPDLLPHSLICSSESCDSLAEFEQVEMSLADGHDSETQYQGDIPESENINGINSFPSTQCNSIQDDDDHGLYNGYSRHTGSSLYYQTADSLDHTDIGSEDMHDGTSSIDYDSEDSLSLFERYELAIAQDPGVTDILH